MNMWSREYQVFIYLTDGRRQPLLLHDQVFSQIHQVCPFVFVPHLIATQNSRPMIQLDVCPIF